MKLTLAITVYNRYEMLLESFANVIDDSRIDEILIMDDASEPEYWNKIKDLPKFNPKIKVIRQAQNRGMSVNKRDAVFNSSNEWVILFDSDNVIGKDYLDAIQRNIIAYGVIPWTWILCPSFAKPNFNYYNFKQKSIGRSNCSDVIKTEMGNCLFNTCNYVINKEWYLTVFEENDTVGSADTIWFNYCALKRGGTFYVVPGMHYEHRVHPGSGFLQDADYNMKKAEEIKQLIMQL